MIPALSDTLFLAYCLALRSQGVADCNSTLGDRLPLALLWREGMHGIPSD